MGDDGRRELGIRRDPAVEVCAQRQQITTTGLDGSRHAPMSASTKQPRSASSSQSVNSSSNWSTAITSGGRPGASVARASAAGSARSSAGASGAPTAAVSASTGRAPGVSSADAHGGLGRRRPHAGEQPCAHERRLAAPRSADDRDEPRRRDARQDLLDLPLAAEEQRRVLGLKRPQPLVRALDVAEVLVERAVRRKLERCGACALALRDRASRARARSSPRTARRRRPPAAGSRARTRRCRCARGAARPRVAGPTGLPPREGASAPPRNAPAG